MNRIQLILFVALLSLGNALVGAPLPGRYSGTLKKTTEVPGAALTNSPTAQKIAARITDDNRIYIIMSATPGQSFVFSGALNGDGTFQINIAPFASAPATGTADIVGKKVKLSFSATFGAETETGQPVIYTDRYSITLTRVSN